VIGNDGEGKEKGRNSGGRSFQRPGPLMNVARLENMRREVNGVEKW